MTTPGSAGQPVGPHPTLEEMTIADIFLALAGYPAISVPAGFAFGLSVGITFMGRAFSEPALLKFAYAFEGAAQTRQPPTYAPPGVLPPAPPDGIVPGA